MISRSDKGAIKNPFFHRSAIRDPEYFSDRKKEVRRTLEMLSKGQSVSIIGPRKIGKTSFLFHISRPDVMHEYELDWSRYLLVYINCEGLGGLSREAVYTLMLDEITDQAIQQGRELETVDHSVAYFTDFEHSLNKLLKNDLRLVLLFDEFEGFSANHGLGNEFFGGLRALATRADMFIAYVTASNRPLSDLLSQQDTSNFFNIFSPLYLKLFDIADSTGLIDNYTSKIGITLGQQAIDMALDLARRHPFFLQVACYWVLELQFTKGGPLEFKDLKILKSSMRGEIEPHFEYYWDHLTSQEQYVLAALPLAQSEDIYREELGSLSSLCLIAKENKHYEYFSPLFREFVRLRKAPDILQAGPFVILLQRREVLMQEKPLALGAKQFDLLTYLIQHRERVVSNEELDREVMAQPEERQGYHFVSDERLKAAIRELRRTLGNAADYIANKRGVGYVFRIPTEEEAAQSPALL